MFILFLTRSFLVLMWSLSASVLAGCEHPTVNVSVHGINYSGATFSYYVTDPTKPDSSGGGELIDPFAAGGTTCCFSLPKKWRPGIKVQVRTTHWLPKRPDGSLPEVKEENIVEVPPYVDGNPGELWVLRAVDGNLSVISSDFQPDHRKWPGKLKGWPVPSLEYRRERWDLMRNHEQQGIELYLSLLAQLEQDPQHRAEEEWEFSKKDNPAAIGSFSGPDDPRYLLSLKGEYEEGLRRSRKLLMEIEEAKP
jgi:hypothetical protein